MDVFPKTMNKSFYKRYCLSVNCHP